MEAALVQNLVLVLASALVGGFLFRLLKLPALIGYISAGVVGGLLFPGRVAEIEGLAQIGILLLLFSVGLELSLNKLAQVGDIAVTGAILQMLSTTLVSFAFLSLLGMSLPTALVFSVSFALSSTALVVKTLGEKGEGDTLHGRIMTGWLLVQDLAVVPIIALLPALAAGSGGGVLPRLGTSLIGAIVTVSLAFFLGKLITPALIHRVAAVNSQELMVLASIFLALGMAYLVSLFGISPAIGAFLAGVVISESQENHAVFAETRPLRDLFVILFFISLGLLVTPAVLFSQAPLILGLALFVILIKSVIVFSVMTLFNVRGRPAVIAGLGLSQIGEFSFIIFLSAKAAHLISPEMASVGIGTTLVTLVATPFLFNLAVPLWRRAKKISPLFIGSATGVASSDTHLFQNHIIICGFGRMGRWIGQALQTAEIPFTVVDYNQSVVSQARLAGLPVIYGDPVEKKVLTEAGLAAARAVVVAIPDRLAQEEIVASVQSTNPEAKIYARAHLDEDFHSLMHLRVKRVVQPEFEGAVAVVRDILTSIGKNKEEVSRRIKALRTAHATKK